MFYCKTLIFGKPLYLASFASGTFIAKLKDRQYKKSPTLINTSFTSATPELFVIFVFINCALADCYYTSYNNK